nr:MAG TPA: hypothetical protein [Caudoviricetes sp.]
MASVSGDFKEGGQWTATASSFSGNQTVSLSADVNPLSKVRTADLTISAAGISKSCTVSLTQEASEFEAELTVVAIPAFAAGGSSYTATSTSGHIIIKRNGVVIDDRNVMPAFRFKSGSEVSWVTLSGGSGAWTYTITAENRALVAGGSRSATIEAQYSLDVGGVQTLLVCDVPISQVANFVETVSVSDASFAYSTIAAKGATVTPTTDSTIAVTMSSGSTLSSASAIAGYTYTLTPSFSMTNGSGFTLNSTTTGSLTAASMGTTLGSRQSPTITYSLSLTYTPSSELSALGAKTVSGSDSSTGKATQGVNEVTSSTLAVTAFNYQGTVAASGGTSVAPNITVQKNRVYTSGATDSVPVTTYTKTFSIVNDYDSGATIDTSTGLVTFPSRGTTVGLLLNIQVGLVVSADGLSVYSQAGCTQAMNKIESFVVMDISFDWPQFSPAGESHLPTHVGEWCQATYSSGVTGERAKPPVGYTIASNTAVYSLAESSSVFTIVDASTGEVSAANMGTTLGSRTSPYIWKDITIVLAAGSWANGTVENISGTGRARNVANQGVNEITYSDLTIKTFSYFDTSTVLASGGTSVPRLFATETQTYTSGSIVSDVPVTGGSFALTTSGHGASVDSSTGVVTYASRGSVAGDAWSDSVTWTLTSHGLTATKSASVSQEANVETFVDHSNAYAADPSYGGKANVVVVTGGTITATPGARLSYTSGSTVVKDVSASSTSEPVSLGSGASWDASSWTLTIPSAGTLVYPEGDSYSCTIKVTTPYGTTYFYMYRQANVATYDVPVLQLSYGVIAASGGSVTPVKSFAQSVSYTSGSTSTVTSGGTWSYSGTGVNTSTGEVSASSLGTTVKDKTLITTATASLMVNGKTGKASAYVYQAANSATYGAVTISGGTVADIPASGGSVSSASGISGSQTVSFTSGDSRPGTVSFSYSTAVSAPSLGTTVKSRSKVGTLDANAIGDGGVTATKSFDVYQAANSATYGTPTVSISYSDIAASGGSVTPTVSFRQTVTYTSGSTGTPVTSGGSWSYSGTGVNTSTGAVSGNSLGTTEVSRTKKTDATATITINSKSGSATVGVYQEANTIVAAGPVTITDAEVADIPASGGTVSEFTSYKWTQEVTYTSGVTDTSNYHTTSYSDPVTASSLGTTVKSRTKVGTLTLEIVGVKNESATLTLDVYQAANTATYSSPSITASYGSDIPAGGGTVSLTKSFTQNVTYTSGSTGTVSSGGSWSYSQTSGSGLNTSTGAVTAASLGTTAKARSQVASVRVQLTANNKTEAVMASAYQEANSRTWGTPTITTFAYRGTPAVNTLSAGADNRNPTLLATQTGTWTSGETETASLIRSKTFTGGDVNTSTGNYTVTSLGNVVTARQLEATITVNITMNGKTASDSLSLYRAANEVTYSDPIVTHTSPISVAASAGQYQLKPNFTQRAYYTSGSETPILSGSFTYAVKTALTGFTLAPPTGIVSYTTNLSVSPRNGFVVTITGSGNGKSGTTDVTFNQVGAAPEIYVSLNGTKYGSSVTVNLEGKSASEVSVYVDTNDTFDVS